VKTHAWSSNYFAHIFSPSSQSPKLAFERHTKLLLITIGRLLRLIMKLLIYLALLTSVTLGAAIPVANTSKAVLPEDFRVRPLNTIALLCENSQCENSQCENSQCENSQCENS
jgi:hypothetical protein